MEARAIVCAMATGVWLELGCSRADKKAGAPRDISRPRTNSSTVFVPPGQTTPERTLRTFWWAVREGKDGVALARVNRDRIAEGRHGRDIERFINESGRLDTSGFVYVAGKARVSIRSNDHCMDYEMEPTDDGRWVIVSIHP